MSILVHSLSNLPIATFLNIKSRVIRGYSYTNLKKIEYIIGIILSNMFFVATSILVIIIYSIAKIDGDIIRTILDPAFIFYNSF